MLDATKFLILELGTRYALPIYTVVPGKGIEDTGRVEFVTFVRGSKLAEEEVQAHDGVLHEGLLTMQIEDLKFKQSLVYSTETKFAIEALETALFWLQRRSNRRSQEGTLGTYQK